MSTHYHRLRLKAKRFSCSCRFHPVKPDRKRPKKGTHNFTHHRRRPAITISHSLHLSSPGFWACFYDARCVIVESEEEFYSRRGSRSKAELKRRKKLLFPSEESSKGDQTFLLRRLARRVFVDFYFHISPGHGSEMRLEATRNERVMIVWAHSPDR